MAEATTLAATKRTQLGTNACRRLRKQGNIPGNLYGHGQETVSIAASEANLESMIYGGHKVVDLDVDGKVEKAMFREVQWDTFGTRVKHFDLIRISADERVLVEVAIELRGTAEGTLTGGVLEQPLRTLSLECLALDIPEVITIRIGDLEIGQSILVQDIELPPSVVSKNSPETIIVRVVEPKVEEEEDDDESLLDAAQPEVIGRKEEPTEGEDEKSKD